jgi:DNA polymerase I-like protein with 3'-5' exonuclease and polymerase domains
VEVKPDFERSEFLKELEKQTLALNISVNLIETDSEFADFLKSIKAKTLMSISFCVEKIRSDLATDKKLEDVFYRTVDQRDESLLKFYGMSICLDNDKQNRRVNFLLFKQNKEFLSCVRTLLEREDLIKVILFAKHHFKVMSDCFDIKIKLPCYDPVVADWLLNQECSTIFQIKQKYCPSLNLTVNSELRSMKQCYGCCFHSNLKLSGFDCFQTIRHGFTESMIGIYCFDKIKLQLQLQNLWVYFAKIESQIVLIVAQMELNGMGTIWIISFFFTVAGFRPFNR